MHFVSKYIAALTSACVFLLFGSAYANPISLWDIAQPAPAGGFFGPESDGNVFLFETPEADSCIGIGYEFYPSHDLAGNCTGGVLATKTYLAVMVGEGQANKVFYIDASGLYAIAFAVRAEADAKCAKEVDEYSFNNATPPTLTNTVSTPISCESSQCTSGSTAELPGTLSNNPGACA